MKLSARAKRMDRRHRKQIVATISLTALIDIFANLLFFLLINVTMDYHLTPSKTMELPESSIDLNPKEMMTLAVDEQNILLNGRPIVTVASVLAQTEDNIPALTAELQYLASKNPVLANDKGESEREITVMGDKHIPYELLKRIMSTCSAAEYSKISLAVLKVGEK
ncbi:Conserved hypothetical protein [gamma proteobacterium HdN1]|nr:Conserved hypothetical protein [gamma proteobacterium HdN1]